jgi:DNA-binding MarR family transcriptional regulator
MPKKTTSENDLQNELADIKKLLILKLMSDGIPQSQIATILKIDPGNLSRMVPARLAKKNNKNSN